MALPIKLKSLIDKYCMGVSPSDAQMDEIFNLAGLLNANSKEVSDYMQEMISGPTKEEREAQEEADRKKAEAAAKRRAILKEKKEREKREAEQRAKLEAEAAAKREAERKAIEAKRKAEFEAKEAAKREAEEKAIARTGTWVKIISFTFFPILFSLLFLVTEGLDYAYFLLMFSGVGVIAPFLFLFFSDNTLINWLFILFYVGLGISSQLINFPNEMYNSKYEAYINAKHLENYLSSEYGQEYSFHVKYRQKYSYEPESSTVNKRIYSKDVLFEIIIQEEATQNQDTIYLVEPDEEVQAMYDFCVNPVSKSQEIKNEIIEWYSLPTQ